MEKAQCARFRDENLEEISSVTSGFGGFSDFSANKQPRSRDGGLKVKESLSRVSTRNRPGLLLAPSAHLVHLNLDPASVFLLGMVLIQRKKGQDMQHGQTFKLCQERFVFGISSPYYFSLGLICY
jgi:hypothetical protein